MPRGPGYSQLEPWTGNHCSAVNRGVKIERYARTSGVDLTFATPLATSLQANVKS